MDSKRDNKRVTKLQQLKGQLAAIENELENELDFVSFQELCDCTGTIGGYIRSAIKNIKDNENDNV